VERAQVDGLALEYWAAGRGEPVVGIHGAFVADAFRRRMAMKCRAAGCSTRSMAGWRRIR